MASTNWRITVGQIEGHMRHALQALLAGDRKAAQTRLQSAAKAFASRKEYGGDDDADWRGWAVNLAVTAAVCNRWISLGDLRLARAQLGEALESVAAAHRSREMAGVAA